FGQGPNYPGTVPYMSPEQARGEGHLVDPRSDVHGLGIVFFEMLTGQRPFRSDNRDELMEQIRTREPPPPRQIDRSIPRELDRICLKALAKRASERYSTAQDFADDLRHWQAASQNQATEPAGPGNTASVSPLPVISSMESPTTGPRSHSGVGA